MHIVLISLHGLIRGHDLELGRDADTGGQTRYVVELARALGDHPEVDRVTLLTRRMEDPRAGTDYAEMVESLGPKAEIVRLNCGGGEYRPKEEFWDFLDEFVMTAVHWLRYEADPDDVVLHAHYADAGEVARLIRQEGVNVPVLWSAHSLGRVKRSRLLASGMQPEVAESRYRLNRRILAEETALETADRVIASSLAEIDDLARYHLFQPDRAVVNRPGVDTTRFTPVGSSFSAGISISQFIDNEDCRPSILAIARPDEKKNLSTLVATYGASKQLRDAASLILLAGNRDDIRTLDSGARSVWTELLLLIDRYDLYGDIAIPKTHTASEIPEYYRFVHRGGGVFVNPALVEPFGLTLLEAAASGVPVVATRNGGPREIIATCRNGILIDPLSPAELERALLDVLSDRWKEYSQNGIAAVREHYSWAAHADRYLEIVRGL